MFQLTDMESEHLRSQFATANISNMSRYNPFVFTEQGIYMLMTVLKGDLAEKQSIALVRVFKQMKDFISDCNKTLVTSDEFYKLATLTAENTAEISRIKTSMLEKDELDRIVKSFSEKRLPKDYVLLNGQIVEAALAYSEIYSKAKKTIYIVDNYIGLKTLQLLRASNPSINVIIFSDNIGNMLRQSEYNDYMNEYGYPTISFRQTAGIFHDRYIVLDYKTKNEKIYHCGASSKDAGKRTTSISIVDDSAYYHNMVDMLLQNPILVLK